MSSLFTSLGELAESYGKAGTIREKEKVDQHNIDVDNARLQLEKQSAQLRQQEFQGHLMDLGIPPATEGGVTYKQLYSPAQAKFVRIPIGSKAGGLDSLRRVVMAADPKYRQQLMDLGQTELESDPEHPGNALKAIVARQQHLEDQTNLESRADDRAKSEAERQADREKSSDARQAAREKAADARQAARERAAGGNADPQLIRDLAARWRKGDPPPAKVRAQVEQYMEENGIPSGRKLNAQENRVLDLANQTEPKVGQLKKLIEDAGLTGSNDWVFGDRSALMQHLRMFTYGKGVAPDKLGGDLIKAAAALQVMGAGPWMQMGRGKYLFETIKQHLPSPTDTPQQLYEKAIFLQSILDEAKGSLDVNDPGKAGESSTGKPKVVIGKDGSITVQ